MGWRDLLAKDNETVSLPWLGGRELRARSQVWTIEGKLPRDHGWYTFKLVGRKATDPAPTEVQSDQFQEVVVGYLVGDRVVKDGVRVEPDLASIAKHSERVHLLEPGLDRFSRVSAGRVYDGGPLVFRGLEMPLGPEEAVVSAFLDEKASVDDIKGVAPALDAAFRMEIWQRAEAEKRRLELERLRKEEEERRAKEERRKELVRKLGDGASRRELAQHDFPTAARAALAMANAEFLDHRPNGRNKNEYAVKFRFDGRRFECICDHTLRIVDAGICLIDHDTDEKGDTLFTLESLPAVIRQATREGRLVIFRHV